MQGAVSLDLATQISLKKTELATRTSHDQERLGHPFCSLFHCLVIILYLIMFPSLQLEYVMDKWLCLTFHVHWIIPVCMSINMMAQYRRIIL